MTCLCTPIFIHSSVVVVRLYWFEKRFQNIVLERGNGSGRTRTLSRRKSEGDAARRLVSLYDAENVCEQVAEEYGLHKSLTSAQYILVKWHLCFVDSVSMVRQRLGGER